MARLLSTQFVEKPWGRHDLPERFAGTHDQKIGEVWFDGGPDLALLVKYLFTSERLSIQVHPDDATARKRGLRRGKSECWYVLEAERGAELGLGLTQPVAEEELRRAALDGTIENLIHWRAVRSGDFFMVPAGTVHAIGAGITLLEFQQNSDTTFRLYDYGRPRELHLDDGLSVAVRAPYAEDLAKIVKYDEEQALVCGPQFSLVHALRPDGIASQLSDRRRWAIPLEGEVAAEGCAARPGECLLAEAGDAVSWSGRLLLGVEGPL